MKVLEAFKRHKTPLNIGVEMPTIEAIKRFVAAGNGVALVPGIAVEPELNRGELVAVPVKELKLERKLRIVYRKGGQLSHAARAFLQVAESISGKAKGPLSVSAGKMRLVRHRRPLMAHRKGGSDAHKAGWPHAAKRRASVCY